MKVKFVAEVSSNHNRDLDRSMEFIKTASGIGCHAVKFQLFRIGELFAPEALKAKPSLLKRKEWELPLEFLPVLSEYAHKLNLEFSCTPFYLDAVDELEPFVDFYKIASYEILWSDLLIRTAGKNKPMVLSTGMATLEEIGHAVNVVRKSGNDRITLLHCISGYPTPPSEANLSAIRTLEQAFGCPVGWSDHSADPGVIHRAVHKWGAEMIEFHLDLEGKGSEFQSGHCWLPNQISQVIKAIGAGLDADGSGEKVPSPSELNDLDWRADPEDGLRPLRSKRKELQ